MIDYDPVAALPSAKREGGAKVPSRELQALAAALNEREDAAEAKEALLAIWRWCETVERVDSSLRTSLLHAEGQIGREILKGTLLARVTTRINASLDFEAVAHQIVDLPLEMTRAENAVLTLADGRRFARAQTPAGERSDSEALPPSSMIDAVLRGEEAVYCADAQAHARWKHDGIVAELGLRAVSCVPLRVQDRVIGALSVDSRLLTDIITRSDHELLTSLANQSALALENARLFSEEQKRARANEQLEAFRRRILEAVGNGVITLDAGGKISTFNRAAEATFGIEEAAIAGSDASALIPLIPEFADLLETFFRSGAVTLRAEVERETASGAAQTLQVRFSPMQDAAGMGVTIVVLDVTEQRGLQVQHEEQVVRSSQIADSFSRYLAPHVVQSLMREPGKLRLGGERARATMLFADIRGFTTLASGLPAERVVEILNTYFTEAVKAIFAYDGLLDKFYGDGLLAVFGPPRVREDDAQRAVAAALRLHRATEELGPRLQQPLQISIGLATGEVVAGHIGSEARMDYTVIGDAVNLAAALQSAAPPGAIYCDDATYELSRTALPSERVVARVKGRNEFLRVHALTL
jgi:PAS domain S-box-containing protein